MHYYCPRISPFILVSTIYFIFFGSYLFADCPPGFKAPKKKYFEIIVCGDDYVSASKLEHAALVLKGIIDFNNDAKPDNSKIIERLYSGKASFLVI